MDESGSDAVAKISRVWSEEHQTAFARATGDVNPMHMDVHVARRTLAGGRAVHGVHAALWALDSCARAHGFERLSALQIRFERFVLVGDRADISVKELDGQRLQLSLSVGGMRALTIQAILGGERPPGRPVQEEGAEIPVDPIVVEPSALAGMAGTFRILNPTALSALVPNLAQTLGLSRVAAIGALSTLVGMVVPGLHSILSKIDLTFTKLEGDHGLVYAVKRFQPTLRSLTTHAVGPGIDARVESFMRPLAVEPASLVALKALVHPSEFADVSALIIGGSRGLGATTAKLIAAGGGRVAITFLHNSAEAERVAREIDGAGGQCEILQYDATERAVDPLRTLQLKPSHLYHFATPQIFRQKRAPFEPDFCTEMMQVYNYAFYKACLFCLARSNTLRAFYPSTIAIDERPRDTLEYVTAKAAGEALAAMMGKTIPNLTVICERLPRIETDQTATIFPIPAADPSAVMLPIVRRMSA